ncbi:sulfatase-like hydrolase/transferase [Planctomycetota bacterium]|nr:sulfatase-like hydrolase/transferase [Planctomycetota bacterium]
MRSLALAAMVTIGAAQVPQPNIVLVIADDLGYGDVGCYGAPNIRTPRIDAMAQEGARLTAFYVAPTCSPTRAGLMTGAYAPRVGVRSPLGSWAREGLAPSEVTLAEVLSAAGYRTGLFGKWHLGDSPDQLPTAQGFDESFGSPWGLPGRPHALVDGGEVVDLDSDPVTWTPRFVDRTLGFIEHAAAAKDPFFVVLSHTSPHQPATASPNFVGISSDGREYGDSVEEIDASVGAVLDRVDALGLRDDTLVLFFSDNGPAGGQDPYQSGSAGPLRGWKGMTYEGGVRVPCVVRWPAVTPPGIVSAELVHVVDLFETLARAAGAPLGSQLPTRDGVDVTAILAGGAGDPHRVVYHFRVDSLDSVRRGRWKLKGDELYDLELDPSESVDLAAQHGAIAASLARLKAAKVAEVTAGARPLAPTVRRSLVWRGDTGLTSPSLGPGARWEAAEGHTHPWQVLDFDPGVDLELLDTQAPPGSMLPGAAVRLPAHAPRLQLRRPGGALGVDGPGAPFTLGLWFRSMTDAPAQASVLLDVGDAFAGLSVTMGDAGISGDDGYSGQLDDLRLRVGGSGTGAAVSLSMDLPSGPGGWAREFAHLVVTYNEEGVLRAYLNGFLAGSTTAAGLDAGLDGQWALFGRHGSIGGQAGPGMAPFDAVSFAGDIAGIRSLDREISRKEAELLLCRHVAYAYCAPLPRPGRERIRFDVAGDFRSTSRRLEARVTGVGASAFGVLLASQRQTRIPALGGDLCVDMNFVPAARPLLFPTGSAGLSLPMRDLTFSAELIGAWNFQVWTRESGRPAFSNALRVLFGP